MDYPAARDRVVDGVYAAFGVDAVYTPPGGGASINCRVIVNGEDVAGDFSGARFLVAGRRIEVRSAELPAPILNGQLVIASLGETLVVAAAPRIKDPDQRIWSIECHKAS